MALDQAEYVLSLPAIPDGADIHLGKDGEAPRERAPSYGWPHYNSPEQIAIRDKGAYMDPRSRKDWW